MIVLTKRLRIDEKQTMLRAFGWIRFSSRTICLRKKDKEPDKVTNLRPIQVSPWTFKIAEQSRQKLKNWIDANTSPKCYAFKKKTKIDDLINWIKSWINSQKI